MEIPAPFRRVRAVLTELGLDMQVRALLRRERRVLARLGAAAASAGTQEPGELGNLLAQICNGRLKLDELRASIGASLEEDRADFMTASRWMRPVIVLRGLCSRAVLRHQVAIGRRSLAVPHETLGAAVAKSERSRPSLPPELFRAVEDARADLCVVLEERSHRLAPYGGSALPKWFPHLGGETKALGRALWMQLRPTILPRSPALVGLAVGWWVANTYTASHFRSVLHSLGIGQGGHRVVSGETYRTMIFWLPILAAAVCAYLADRAQLVIQRRYSRASPDQ